MNDEDAAPQTISPTGTYSVTVPNNIAEDVDGNITSIWIPGDDTLLQLSSSRRETGQQVTARERLGARLEREQAQDIRHAELRIPGCDDAAGAVIADADGANWLYAYAVWPDLAIFITISHPEKDPTSPSWALDALCSVRR
jgi:hypothetical protein